MRAATRRPAAPTLALAASLALASGATAATTGRTILVPSAALIPRMTSGATVDADPGETIRNRASRALPLPDAVLMTAPSAGELCAQGLLAPVGTAAGCGVPAVQDALLLLAGGGNVSSPRWRDLWEITRLPGRRGLPREAIGVLEIALLADGVAPGGVYRMLGTDGGAARAFRKLDQLRPYIAWWTEGAEARRALLSGAVMMTVLPADQVGGDASTPTASAAFRAGDMLAVPLVWTRPDARGRAAARTDATPPLETLAAATPPVPLPAGTASATLAIDGVFWRDHQDLRARFRAWLGR